VLVYAKGCREEWSGMAKACGRKNDLCPKVIVFIPVQDIEQITSMAIGRVGRLYM
jgi:hypothetical protein